MSVRVLLGADGGLAASLRAQIAELADIAIVAVEGTSADVVGAAGQDPALDVVLVHQEIDGLPAMDLIRELAMRHPQLAVVLIAEDASAETYSAAMEAGARGVVSSRPTQAELQSRIGSASEWSRTMRRHLDPAHAGTVAARAGTVVALCGAKGGTGTTTLTVQLALAVVAAGKRVCIVDMDLQKGDIPSYLDITPRRSIADLVAAAADLDGTTLAEAIYVHRDGPHVLMAPAEGEQAEDVPARATRQILGGLRGRYDYVIADCGAYMTEASAVAIELADTVLVTATPDLPCLRAVQRLTRMWGRLQVRKDEELSVVLVRTDRRNEVQPDFARKVLGLPMLRTTVPASYRALEEAANTGSPKAVEGGDYRRAIGGVAREIGLFAGDGEGRRMRGDRGVALTEFTALLPFLGLLLLLVWQFILIGLTSMYSSHAANEAARAVAVLGYDTPQARAEVDRRAVARVSGPWGDKDHFHVAVDQGYVKVTIDTPAMLPGWHTSWGVSTRSRIVYEEGAR
ncbi:AAA family ATPase [Actinomadura sp. DC4]|uniref:AAA family ATPase n=1 Tax=Actinomadura sp. DC4 TaxID=3055069 RepID=UPI0025B079A6|nr:AAA family ATPase [Actinomadura sp. DC4]MDN3356897.1 AAA family ATPase [Actinomadura sp. DC4]